jgi:hypothetical protein
MRPTMSDLPFTRNPLRTRADVQQLVRDLITPVLPHFSPGRAQVLMGPNRALYGDPAGLLEGFSRTLWGIVPLTAGGGEFAHWDFWRAGFSAGTDPSHAEYWGEPGDFDQRSVEMAAMGLALSLAPKETWSRFTPAVQTRLATWLGRINRVQLVDSNWLFFRVLVNLGLKHCGQAWSQEKISADLDRLDQFYRGDGWYADGAVGTTYRNGRLGDYYVPMGFHFYSLLYARLAGAEDPVRAARYVERARIFSEDFLHWFSGDGAALPFGRSLTYRFAQAAFWGAVAFAPVAALPWPVVKGLYLRHLRWWLRQPVFSETGLLTIGYAYPNLVASESYNSSGSPYWGMKVFLPLALPAEHPFWTAEEAPLPKRAPVRTVSGANLVLTSSGANSDVIALNPGQPVYDWPRHAPSKYSKFAYSTRFAFSVPVSSATLEEGGFDSMLALSDDNRRYRVREFCHDPEVRNGVAYSRWTPWPDIEVRTWLIAAGDGAHVRVHRVRTPRPVWSAECGFAVGYASRASLKSSEAQPDFAEVRSPRGVSALRNLEGKRQGSCSLLGASSHLLTSLSAMPVLQASHVATEFWLACIACGSAADEAQVSLGDGYSFEADGESCRVRRNGAEWWSVASSGCGQRVH